MYIKKVNKFFIIKYLLFLFAVMISLSGCGQIQSTSSIVRHIENKYNIKVNVISEEKNTVAQDKYSNYNSVTLMEKDRNIIFNAKSSFSAVGMDGSTFWHSESISDDYYKNLTDSIKDELCNIEDKYEIRLDYIFGLVSSVDYYGMLTNKDEQFEKIKDALNEIMKIYDLKKEISNETIIIKINGKYTGFYCTYTPNGKSIELIDEDKEWRERWGIPERLEKDVLEYVNSMHSGECYIVNCEVIPEYYNTYDDDMTYIRYRIRNDYERTEKEYTFNLDKYKNDYKNNKLLSLDEYLKDTLDFVY